MTGPVEISQLICSTARVRKIRLLPSPSVLAVLSQKPALLKRLITNPLVSRDEPDSDSESGEAIPPSNETN